MSENVLILSADRYEFTNEKTGEVIKGANAHYVSDYKIETEKSVGQRPIKVRIADEVFTAIQLNVAPGIYDITTRTKPGKESKAEVVVTKAVFREAVTLANFD